MCKGILAAAIPRALVLVAMECRCNQLYNVYWHFSACVTVAALTFKLSGVCSACHGLERSVKHFSSGRPSADRLRNAREAACQDIWHLCQNEIRRIVLTPFCIDPDVIIIIIIIYRVATRSQRP